MKAELIEQNIQYTFINEKYTNKDGKKNRVFKHVKTDASADSLVAVGRAIADLQGDDLDNPIIIKKEAINVMGDDENTAQ